MKKVSIIVPVYNVENYLEKTIESIISQTYQNLEILLVDDGATDHSPQICDEYGAKDERIIVIHKENAGIAKARNTGLENITGEYCMFVDSDDYIETHMVETLVNTMEHTKSDMVTSGYQKVDEDGAVLNTWNASEKIFMLDTDGKKVDYIIDTLLKYSISWEVWNKLYRSSIIKEHKIAFRMFNGKITAEDVCFNLEYALYMEKAINIEDMMYMYVQRANSVIHTVKAIDSISDKYNTMAHMLLQRMVEEKTSMMEQYDQIYCALLKIAFDKLYFNKIAIASESISDNEFFEKHVIAMRKVLLKDRKHWRLEEKLWNIKLIEEYLYGYEKCAYMKKIFLGVYRRIKRK